VISVHHALNDQSEREDFEQRVLPLLSEYVAFWGQRGTHVPSRRLKIYVEPDTKSAPIGEILESLYGKSFSSELEKFREAVVAAPTARDAHRLAREFHCAFPPLLVGRYHDKLPAESTPEQTRSYKQRLLKAVAFERGGAEPVNGFRQDNAFYAYRDSPQCDYVAIGRSIDTTRRRHSFLAEDIVFHEVGHAFVAEAWSRQAEVPYLDPSITSLRKVLDEGLADIYSHAYLGTACHNKFPAPDESGKRCGRRMDQFDRPMFDALANRESPHSMPQALRHLAWVLLAETGRDRFAMAFSGAIAGLEGSLRNQAIALLPESLRRDSFLAEENEFRRGWWFTGAFVDALCSRLEHLGEVGSDLRHRLESYVKNAPLSQPVEGVEGHRSSPNVTLCEVAG
jgi:hypothetical protein